MKKKPQDPCTPFNPRNDERLSIGDDRSPFTIKLSEDQFNKRTKHTCSNWIETTDLPEHNSRREFLKSLKNMQANLQKAKQEKIRLALAEVDNEFYSHESFYNEQIAKFEAMQLLEEEFDLEVRQKDRKV